MSDITTWRNLGITRLNTAENKRDGIINDVKSKFQQKEYYNLFSVVFNEINKIKNQSNKKEQFSLANMVLNLFFSYGIKTAANLIIGKIGSMIADQVVKRQGTFAELSIKSKTAILENLGIDSLKSSKKDFTHSFDFNHFIVKARINNEIKIDSYGKNLATLVNDIASKKDLAGHRKFIKKTIISVLSEQNKRIIEGIKQAPDYKKVLGVFDDSKVNSSWKIITDLNSFFEYLKKANSAYYQGVRKQIEYSEDAGFIIMQMDIAQLIFSNELKNTYIDIYTKLFQGFIDQVLFSGVKVYHKTYLWRDAIGNSKYYKSKEHIDILYQLEQYKLLKPSKGKKLIEEYSKPKTKTGRGRYQQKVINIYGHVVVIQVNKKPYLAIRFSTTGSAIGYLRYGSRDNPPDQSGDKGKYFLLQSIGSINTIGNTGLSVDYLLKESIRRSNSLKLNTSDLRFKDLNELTKSIMKSQDYMPLLLLTAPAIKYGFELVQEMEKDGKGSTE